MNARTTSTRIVRRPLAAAAFAAALSLPAGAGLLSAAGAIGLVTLAVPAPAVAADAPDEFVRKVSTDVLDKIRNDKGIQSGDAARISEFVDQTVMPHVNFERMTALAVGRGWRQATPDQQKKLMTEFRALLLRTYSGALSQVRDEQIRMKPFRGEATGDVVVRSEVVPKRGDPIQLDYRLEKANDHWKIYDLNVLGVWLVETYRNQFSQEIGARGIDGLIQSLTEKNKAFDTGKKS